MRVSQPKRVKAIEQFNRRPTIATGTGTLPYCIADENA